MRTLRIILHDQLSFEIASLQNLNRKEDTVLLIESKEHCTHARHHKKKLVFLLSAMRHFAEALQKKKINVTHCRLDDPENVGTLYGETKRVVEKKSLKKWFLPVPANTGSLRAWKN